MAVAEMHHITDAEWEIMRVVWTQGTTTSKEVQQILNQKTEWKTTTVKPYSDVWLKRISYPLKKTAINLFIDH